MLLKVALLQMVSAGFDQAANLAKGEDFCRRAKAMGADIALFPEMWNIGYSFFDPAKPGERDHWAKQAITDQSSFFRHFQDLSRELEMAIALTYLEQGPGAPRNTVTLINRYGESVLTYAKVHTCDFDIESALAPGAGFYVCDLDTAQGVIKIGAMICMDREFPESARVLMLKGAEIILTPNACDLELNRLAQFRSRAYENMVGLAMANYAAPQCNGHSIAFDGVAFDQSGNSRDMLLIEAGESEAIYMATFDMARLRDYREREVWGNAFRKPQHYTSLVDLTVSPPFIRSKTRC